MKSTIASLALSIFTLLAPNAAHSEPADLMLGLGDQVQSFNLQTLQSKFQTRELVITHQPAYSGNGTADKVRKYRGVSFKEVLLSLLTPGESLKDYVVAVTCLDGYNPILDQKVLSQVELQEGLIAWEQLDIHDAKSGVSPDGKWELIPAPWGIVSPAPFYLVWSNPVGTYAEGWPHEIKSMQLIKLRDYENILDKLRPAADELGKNPKTKVEIGYDQFRSKCMTCHNINGVGGKKAPENLLSFMRGLNSEREVLELVSFMVRNPPPAMSDIKDIKNTDEDLAQIAAYLRHMATR